MSVFLEKNETDSQFSSQVVNLAVEVGDLRFLRANDGLVYGFFS